MKADIGLVLLALQWGSTRPGAYAVQVLPHVAFTPRTGAGCILGLEKAPSLLPLPLAFFSLC